MASKEKVVLAYSGGLDTSCCVKWLQDEKNLDVIAVVGEVGQEHDGLEKVKQKALGLGVLDCFVIDMREEFANHYLKPALAANSMYENMYPLLSALSRPLISKYLVEVAHKYGAKYIAHGCTGKGNDQVRFESSIITLDPTLTILAPVREWDLLTRPDEMQWAREHGIEVGATKETPYSIDDNLWGRAIECGVLEDPFNEPPDDVFTITADAADAPDTPQFVELEFEGGVPCAIDGTKKSYLDIIYDLNEIAGKHGVGRIDMVENRMVGVKSRECYECPAAVSLIAAHQALEAIVLERNVQHQKLQLEHTWANCVYNGQWFSPLKQAIDAFMASTQQYVSGTVRLKFFKATCTPVARKSKFSLYDQGLATYDKGDTFDRSAAAGFIQIETLPVRTWAMNRNCAK